MPGVLSVLLAGSSLPVATGIAINDSDLVLSPASAQATNQILADGTVEEGGVAVGDLLVGGDPADVEIYVETTSGSVTSGTVDAWVAISTNPAWTVVRNPPVGTSQYLATYKLRQASSGVEFFTGGTFALTAEVDI